MSVNAASPEFINCKFSIPAMYVSDCDQLDFLPGRVPLLFRLSGFERALTDAANVLWDQVVRKHRLGSAMPIHMNMEVTH